MDITDGLLNFIFFCVVLLFIGAFIREYNLEIREKTARINLFEAIVKKELNEK